MDSSNKPIRVVLDRGPDRSHDIVFAGLNHLPSLLDECGLSPGRCIVVSDQNVAAHHADILVATLKDAGFQPRVILIEPGEGSKSMQSLSDIIDQALAEPIDRRTVVLALGGGVVGDLAGFMAATLLRGVPLVQIPTSLVAQVDSAIGGKTGVNHETGKNLIGSFHQPRLVAIDVDLMQTLPDNEWMDGLSEVVKYGLISDADFVAFLIEHWPSILARDRNIVVPMVRRCAEIKADVVSRDETEQGVRAILNFGHTFGHALERVAGYRGLTHGQGVAVGMRAALHLSHLLYPDVDFREAQALLDMLPLIQVETSLEALMPAMATDKKNVGGRLRFVVLRNTGRAVVAENVERDEVIASWRFALRAKLGN